MSVINIIILVILALVLFWGLKNLIFKTNIIYDKMCVASKVVTTTDATLSTTNIIVADDIPETTSSNFTLSVWFYIDNWGNNIGNEKNILYLATRADPTIVPGIKSNLSGISKKVSTATPATPIYKNINIVLDEYENNLFIDIECFGISNETIFTRYKIPNIPVQKWNNLTISVDVRTLDVYLDGKLRNSFILHGLYTNYYRNSPAVKKNMYLGNISNTNPGFEGFITRIRYEGDSCNPQDAYNIYKEGIYNLICPLPNFICY